MREKTLNNSYSAMGTINNQTGLHYNYDNSMYSPQGTIESKAGGVERPYTATKTEKRNMDIGIGGNKYSNPFNNNEEGDTSFENFRRNKVV
jgi:hypothetical protein